MKNKLLFSALALCSAVICLTACGDQDSAKADNISEAASPQQSAASAASDDSFEVISAAINRSGIYTTADELTEHSAAVVIGEFTSDEGTEFSYQDPAAEKDLYWAVTKAGLKIEKVLAGSLTEENIILSQNYGFKLWDDGKKLLAFTKLAPMNVGEKWLIFLSRSEDGSWWTTSDEYGRWPLPSELGKKDKTGFVNGRLDENDFDENLCRELYTRFNLE